MERETKVQLLRAGVQLAFASGVNAVVGTAISSFKPQGLGKVASFVWELGDYAVTATVTEVVCEYFGRVYDRMITNDPECHIFPDLILPKQEM